MTEQIVDMTEASMPASSDVVAAARSAGGAAGLEAGRTAAAGLAGDMRDRVNALAARVDVLAASGSDGGDVGSELRDVRVGADGTTYASAGEAVRGQLGKTVRSVRNVAAAPIGAPYDDLDTLPANGIVTYSVNMASNGVAHVPDGVSTGTVATLSGTRGSTGAFQLLMSNDGDMFIRNKWAGPWSTWWRVSKADDAPIGMGYESAYSSLSLFERIGVIGDSYASGEIFTGGHYVDHYPLSWGQNLARMCGVDVVNLSSGGLTTRSWLTAARGLPMLKSTEAQNLYMIALGINDVTNLGAGYLGSVDDLLDEWTGNPDTFHGNYGRIIGEIREHAPAAKIILMTLARNDGLRADYNTAIETIAEHEGIPVIRQYEDPFFTSTFYKSMIGGHPTAVTYAGMALAIQRLFSRCAVQYKSYFDDYTGND